MRPRLLARAEPQREDDRVDDGRPDETRRLRPQDLPNEQIAQMLAAMHVAREQQHASRRAQHEYDADHRFLYVRPDPLGPCEEQRAGQRRGECRDLHGDALRFEAQLVGEQHAAARDLRDREIDEHDPAREHLHAERHVGRRDQDARHERRQQDRKLDRAKAHCAPFKSRAIVSSKRP